MYEPTFIFVFKTTHTC